MDGKKIAIIGAGVVVLILLALLLIVKPFGGGAKTEDPTRMNTLRLAEEYLDKQEFQRALDLLDTLLIKDVNDQEARDLRDRVIQARQKAEEEARAAEASRQDDLKDTLSSLGSSLQNQQISTQDAAAAAAEAERRRLEDELRRQQEMAALEEQIRQAEERKRQEEERLAQLSQEAREKELKVQQLIREGIALLEDRSFVTARNKFNEALGLDVNSAPAYAYMGEAYFQEDEKNQMNIQKAVENANRAVERDRNLWVPHNTLGKIYVQTRNWDNAVAEFREASRLNPENADLLFELGKAQYRAGKFADARQSFESCIHLQPEHERAYYNLGTTFMQLGNLSQALTAYKKAAQIDPTYASAHFSAADVLSRQKNYAAAQEYYKKAAVLEPDNDRYLLAQGINEFRLNTFAVAEGTFRKALAVNDQLPETNYNLSLTLVKLGKPAEALEYAVKAV